MTQRAKIIALAVSVFIVWSLGCFYIGQYQRPVPRFTDWSYDVESIPSDHAIVAMFRVPRFGTVVPMKVYRYGNFFFEEREAGNPLRPVQLDFVCWRSFPAVPQ